MRVAELHRRTTDLHPFVRQRLTFRIGADTRKLDQGAFVHGQSRTSLRRGSIVVGVDRDIDGIHAHVGAVTDPQLKTQVGVGQALRGREGRVGRMRVAELHRRATDLYPLVLQCVAILVVAAVRIERHLVALVHHEVISGVSYRRSIDG